MISTLIYIILIIILLTILYKLIFYRPTKRYKISAYVGANHERLLKNRYIKGLYSTLKGGYIKDSHNVSNGGYIKDYNASKSIDVSKYIKDNSIGLIGGKKIKGGIIDRSHLINYADTCLTISFLQLISNSYHACEGIVSDYIQNSKFDKKLIEFVWDTVDPSNNILHTLLSKYPNSKNKFKSIEEFIIPLYAAYLIIVFNYSHHDELFNGKLDLITRYIAILNLIIMSTGDKDLYMKSSKKDAISITDLGIYGGLINDNDSVYNKCSSMYDDISTHHGWSSMHDDTSAYHKCSYMHDDISTHHECSSIPDNISTHYECSSIYDGTSTHHGWSSIHDDTSARNDTSFNVKNYDYKYHDTGIDANMYPVIQGGNRLTKRSGVHGGSDGLDKLSETVIINLINIATSLFPKLKNKSLLESSDLLYWNIFDPGLRVSYVYRTSLVSAIVSSDVLKTFKYITIKENEDIGDHLGLFDKPDIMLVNERYTNIKDHISHVNKLYESCKKSYGDYKVTDMLLTAYTTEGTLFRHMVFYNVLTETMSDNSYNINVTLDELKIDFDTHRDKTNINEAFFTYNTILAFSPVFIHLQKMDKDLEHTLEYQSKNCSPYLKHGYEKGYSQFMYAKKFMEKLKRSNLKDSETKKELIKLHEYLYGNPYVKVWRSVDINTWKYRSMYEDIADYIISEIDKGALDEDDELLELINLSYKEKKSYTLQEAFKRLDS